MLPVLEVTRGQVVECIHFGAAAVVDAQGNLLASCGNTEMVAFLRSSAKPLQCLPFVERNGPRAFGLTERELALLCASHTGSDLHVQTVASIQAKAGINETDLQCGTHLPEDVEAF
jgi:L-asparaginase II